MADGDGVKVWVDRVDEVEAEGVWVGDRVLNVAEAVGVTVDTDNVGDLVKVAVSVPDTVSVNDRVKVVCVTEGVAVTEEGLGVGVGVIVTVPVLVSETVTD